MADGDLHLRDLLPLMPSPHFANEQFFSATSEMEEGEVPEYCAPHLIFMVQAGAKEHLTQGYLDGRRFKGAWEPGLLTFYPAGTRIRVEWKGKCRKAWLELHAPLTALDSGIGPLRRLPRLHPNFLADNLVRDTVLLLSGCEKNMHSGESLYREQLTTRLIAHLEKPPSEPDWALNLNRAPVLTGHALLRAKDYVFDHLFEPISLKEWASELKMNAFHFARSFKATTGLAPYQYVLDQRIQQARLLLEIGRPASEVAARLCFSSASHFGLIFKQHVGLSPSAWKEEHMKAKSSIFQTLKKFETRNLYRPAVAIQ